MKECPTCHRPIEKPKGMICGSCKRPLRRGHKWHVDVSTVRHDDCQNPRMLPLEEPPAELQFVPEGE